MLTFTIQPYGVATDFNTMFVSITKIMEANANGRVFFNVGATRSVKCSVGAYKCLPKVDAWFRFFPGEYYCDISAGTLERFVRIEN